MSHFTEVKVNAKVQFEKNFIAALESRFGEGHVEIADDPGLPLEGYGGDDRSKLSLTDPSYAPLCHIRIRRRHVGGVSNDIGYRRNADGTYTAYVSEYDSRSTFTEKHQRAVAKVYSESVSIAQLKAKGYSVKKEMRNGKLVVVGSVWK